MQSRNYPAAGHAFGLAFLFFALLLLLSSSVHAQPVAFSGAEGFGRFATGGRGGDVYIVTNLNDSGPGSLRDAVTSRTAGVPRTVVFGVSGTIYLNSTLRITKGDLTIAGQTAPGDGICLAHYPIDPSNSSNVVIRFIRSRLGDSSGKENDAFSCRFADNIIVDHCSFSWSVDETASAYINTHFTMQWCIVSESLNDSVHSKGPHGYGGIWGGMGASFHHNLLADHNSRNPRFSGAGSHGQPTELVDMRNNVIYNWKGNSCYGGEPVNASTPSRQNEVNNYFKAGPATGSGSVSYRVLNPSAQASDGSYGLFYVNGNYTTASSSVSSNNWNGGVQGPNSTQQAAMRADAEFEVAPVNTQSAVEAYALVLKYAGCRIPNQDSVDNRIINEVTTGTSTYRGSKNNYPGIIDSQDDVGGWPILESTPPPTDTDSDGMPDDWELAHGLNPGDPADRNNLTQDGYTELEVYLNSLVTAAFPVPVIVSQPQSRDLVTGDSYAMSVTVEGSGPYSYQWFKDNKVLPGATSAEYEISNATAVENGSYSVVIANNYGSVTSDAAVVTVGVRAPSILAQPVSTSVREGAGVKLYVSAYGSAPLSYQWFRDNGDIISGAVSADYVIDTAGQADAGSYYVVVKNDEGMVISDTVSVSVIVASDALIFSTDFSADFINSSSPFVSDSSANWYLMSAKNALASSVGDDPATTSMIEQRPLDLTMVLTTSGIVEAAALFTETPVQMVKVGDSMSATMVFVPTNVRTVGVGLLNSGGVLPFTGMINGELSGGKMGFATGGTQNWTGYRGVGFINSAAPALEARLTQSSTNNTNQSLIVPGTSSSATSILPVGTLTNSDNALVLNDGETYTLSFKISMSSENEYSLSFEVFSGEGLDAVPVFSASGVTTTGGALPDDIATMFDAIGIGYRNRDGLSVSHLTLSSLSIEFQTSRPAKQTASVQLGNLAVTYDGMPHAVSVTTDPSGLSTLVTYDGQSEAPTEVGSYTVEAVIDDTDYMGRASGILVIDDPGLNISQWRQQYFGVADNKGNAANLAEPDGDGIPNLLKYAMAIVPGSNGSGKLPQVSVVDTPGGSLLALNFLRDPLRKDVTLIVEASAELSGIWGEIARSESGNEFTGIAQCSESDGESGLKQVSVVDNAPASPRRFLRIRVVIP